MGSDCSEKRFKINKTLRPKSDFLKNLNLKPGQNRIVYTV